MGRKMNIHIDYASIGSRIKSLRKREGLTLKAWGETLGCENSYLSAIERGKTKPSLQVLLSIMRNTKVSLDWLLTGKENKDSYPSAEKSLLLKYLNGMNIKTKKDMESFTAILKAYLGVEAYQTLISLMEKRKR